MGLAVHFYLFSSDGLQRISQRLREGLARGKDAMPQYAQTKQKIANVIVEMENGKPIRLARVDGFFLTFDEAGQVHKDLVASGFAAMEAYLALEQGSQTKTGKIVDLSPKLNRENGNAKTDGRHRRRIWMLSAMIFGSAKKLRCPRLFMRRELLRSLRL
jgi:hypothetical protein